MLSICTWGWDHLLGVGNLSVSLVLRNATLSSFTTVNGQILPQRGNIKKMLIYSTNNFFLSHKQFTSSETKTRQKSILSLPQFKINAKVTVSKYYSKDLGSNRFGNWKFKTGPCLFVLSVCSLGWIVIWKQLILCKFFFLKKAREIQSPSLPLRTDQRQKTREMSTIPFWGLYPTN